jgi:hypothetical protein
MLLRIADEGDMQVPPHLRWTVEMGIERQQGDASALRKSL